MIVTLAERKAARVAWVRAALEALRASLVSYARENGGRFLIFGSAACGELRFDSDVDILVDFEDAALSRAWSFAESECVRLGFTLDMVPLPWMTAAFVERASRAGDGCSRI